jgi:hypothetical protein
MNIKELDLINIKALLYDLINEREKIENNIRVLEQEIKDRERENQAKINQRKG